MSDPRPLTNKNSIPESSFWKQWPFLEETAEPWCQRHLPCSAYQRMAESLFLFGVNLDGMMADSYRRLRPIAAERLGIEVKEPIIILSAKI